MGFPGEGDPGGIRTLRSYSDADPKRTLNLLLPAGMRGGGSRNIELAFFERIRYLAIIHAP